ncbi:ArnT family glycosyltransferase [Gimesia aquarii]|uniref:Glycosyltransferase RgtA/B/C/D-like domain-containing protein n=1 Tax=Gimesia aquarii TaxID=2527964 RepID=A0A517VXM6_9PLAN|nr:glycosyltransferase family 39 protein [Gimesia aquarii]QDT97757.1 hypothetical protein V144x_32390 [Gimesia aquarii]
MKQTSLNSLLIISLLLIHTVLIAYSANRHSPNLNEPGHLVAGISHWKYQRFELYRVNPPLVRMVAAFIPTFFMNIETNWEHFDERPGVRPVFRIGSDFVIANGENSYWIFTVARWVCIPFSLLGGFFCYRWAKELYGTRAGLLSLSLWCFSPNILAHAQFITPDCCASAMGIVSSYFFWKWLNGRSWLTTLFSGFAMGLALLSKTTWIILFGLWPLLWLVWQFIEGESLEKGTWKSQIIQLATILGIGIYVLNVGYGFEGTCIKLKEYQFVSESLSGQDYADENQSVLPLRKSSNRFKNTWLGEMPVPVPKNYLIGLDVQKKDFEHFGRESYLRGEFRDHGWWYYYLYALAIKVPIGYWIIFILASIHAIACWAGKISLQNLFVLGLPVFTILVLVSSQTEFSHHLRYVLLIFPFVFIWMGQCVLWISKAKPKTSCIFFISFVWAITSSLYCYPHSLSYFNELVRGPLKGHEHLIHSNIDWGQDLKLLKEWIEEHPEAKPMHVCYYGTLNYYGQEDIKALGVDYPLPPINTTGDPNFVPPPGWYAISVNYLKGYGWKQPKNGFTYLQKYSPVARAGYSIYIYHVKEKSLKM